MKLIATVLLTFTALTSLTAHAEYPERPIQLIVPFPAGGAVDTVARSFAQAFDRKINQRVAVLNRDGASTTIGMTALLTAPNDGYTIYYGPVTALTVHLHWMKGLQFNANSFVPVCQAFENVFMVAAPPQSPFKSLDDVLTHARARPGRLTYAHSGVASSPHLTGADLFQRAKVSLVDVPFRGETAMIPMLRDGSVDLAVVSVSFVDIQGLKPFAVFADKRYPKFPNVPTAKELGIPVVPSAYGGLFMRADTPAPIVKKVEAACQATMSDPEFKTFAQRNYQLTNYLGSAQFSARIRADSPAKAQLLGTLKIEQ